jgi:hypothetical protein
MSGAAQEFDIAMQNLALTFKVMALKSIGPVRRFPYSASQEIAQSILDECQQLAEKFNVGLPFTIAFIKVFSLEASRINGYIELVVIYEKMLSIHTSGLEGFDRLAAFGAIDRCCADKRLIQCVKNATTVRINAPSIYEPLRAQLLADAKKIVNPI